MASNGPSPAPVVLAVNDLHIRITDKLICDHQDLILREGDRVGLIGRNGVGKSTILRVLAGIENHYSGEITTRRNLRTACLHQEVTLPPGITVREAVMQGAADILTMIERLHQLSPTSPEAMELDARITACDGWQIDHNIDLYATGLDLPGLDDCVDPLSGGEKRRIALGRALVSHPDFLILDEPTNHLDTESIEWLEMFLMRYAGTCLFVTHDRRFLDRVATRMIELAYGQLTAYDGNYSAFLSRKSERETMAEQAEAKRLSFIRREYEWIRRGPKARGTKAQYRVDRFYDTLNQAAIQRDRDVEIVIPPAPRLGNVVLSLENLGIALGGRRLLSGFSFVFEPGMRIGVVGRNGLGKTTLLRLIQGEITPDAGTVRTGDRTVFNYVDQHRVVLNGEKTVFEEVGEGKDFVELGPRRVGLWAYLKRFLFTDEEIHTLVDRLSGGERGRIVLAKTLKRGGNFLLLDEPTNDLDLATLRVLEEALTTFDGCVVVVSHDRFFLNRVCTGIIGFEGDGQVVYQEGDFDYYLEKRQEREKLADRPPPPVDLPRQEVLPTTGARRKLKWKEERELEEIEGHILEAEEEVAKLEALFSRPDFYEKHGQDTQELLARLDEQKQTVTRLYARWEELEKLRDG